MQKRETLSSSSSVSPPWESLTADLTAEIVQRLAVFDTLRASMVCKSWRRVFLDPSMWRVVVLDWNDLPPRLYYMAFSAKFCHQVLSLTQGQLISLKLGFHANNALLYYLSHISARQLRALYITSEFNYISEEGLCKAVVRFPLLEELQVSNSRIFKRSIEAIGRYCPLLKSFSLINDPFYRPIPGNEEARAIALNLRGLKRLCLVGVCMSNDGLTAILDDCTQLESLRLEDYCCYYLDLGGDLGKRCSQQIKDFKHSSRFIGASSDNDD